MSKHSVRYFAVASNGVRVPNVKGMKGSEWSWAATCAPCGWDSGEPVVHADIVAAVKAHKEGEAAAAQIMVGPFLATPMVPAEPTHCPLGHEFAVYCSCPDAVPADTTAEDMAAAALVNAETKKEKLARQARERRAAKKAAKEAIIEATMPVNSFTR